MVRAGVFRAETGLLCSHDWRNSSGQLIKTIAFRVHRDRNGVFAVHFCPTPSKFVDPRWIRQQVVELATTRCHFGGFRRWFYCNCGRRVQKLYATPREHLLGCRNCLDLAYQSSREHDARVSRLLKLPPEELTLALSTGSLRQRLQAVTALTTLYGRMQKKMNKLRRRPFRTLNNDEDPLF
jgi:hypothetical protein